jgi:predicted esterase
MRTRVRESLVWVCGFALLLPACNFKLGDNNADADLVTSGKGTGEPCASIADCRSGLVCSPQTGTCQGTASKTAGAYCLVSSECLPGLYCSQDAHCREAGTGKEGDACIDGECSAGLTCALSGISGTCVKPGVVDLKGACAQPADCVGGLVCVNGGCQKPALSKRWTGAVCPDDGVTPKALFVVPRAGSLPSEDFYRLPFPNDIRNKSGKITLEGHPRPGSDLIGVDLVDRYIKAIEADSAGFGTNQAVFMRFSMDINLDSVQGKADIIDITPSSPDYGRTQGLTWSMDNGRSNYLCNHHLTLSPPYGHPLRPGTTYAAIVRTGVVAESGGVVQPDDDFVALLAAQPPADPDVAAAWNAYAPLRAYLADAKAGTPLSAANLLVAAVFTTEKVEDSLAGIERAIQAAPAPAISNLVRCGDPGVLSPCDDGKTGTDHVRGCNAASALFDEYQGVVSLPVFQQGKAPYEQPEDGGNVVLDANGVAQIQRNEPVCLSLTVPKGAAPAAGWPLVVYSHGTGGSYRSAVEMGLAADLAAAKIAVISYDGALHANRGGTSTKPVTELVYNFLNPRAARDNALQAAADLVALPRALDGLTINPGIKIDKAHVALYGHSQGGNAASLAAGRDTGYGATVLSGTGGTLIFSLLNKVKPVDIPKVLPFLLGETNPVNARHPVLNLMQMYFERSDTVNFGRRLFAEPLATRKLKPQHVLHIYGTKDTYAPVETQRFFTTAASFPLIKPEVDGYFKEQGFSYVSASATANRGFGSVGLVTAGMLQYAPDGAYDGHFVSSNNPSARAAIQRFLTTFVTDEAPTIDPTVP